MTCSGDANGQKLGGGTHQQWRKEHLQGCGAFPRENFELMN